MQRKCEGSYVLWPFAQPNKLPSLRARLDLRYYGDLTAIVHWTCIAAIMKCYLRDKFNSLRNFLTAYFHALGIHEIVVDRIKKAKSEKGCKMKKEAWETLMSWWCSHFLTGYFLFVYLYLVLTLVWAAARSGRSLTNQLNVPFHQAPTASQLQPSLSPRSIFPPFWPR